MCMDAFANTGVTQWTDVFKFFLKLENEYM